MLDEAKLLEDDFEGGTSRKTWGTSINVDGINYATSLFWQPLQNAKDYLQEVEDASNSILEGADLFCIKGGKAPQFGICVSHEGFKKGQSSAVVALVTALSDVSSFVAVFKTKEGWWYTCVRNDIILSDGDMLFLNEEEAKNQFLSMLAVPDWGKKIAPAEWGIEDTEDADLGELLSRGAKAKLQKIKGLRGSKLIAVVAVSAVVGLWLVSTLVDKIFFTPVKKPVSVPVRPKVIQPVEVKEVPKPWEKIADPAEIMNSCFEGINQLVQILPPGWKIGLISCSNNSVATSWKREFGIMDWMRDALEKSEIKFADYQFDNTGNNITASINLKPAPQLLSPPEYNMVDLRNKINNQFQALGLQIALSEETIKTSAPKPVATKGKGPAARVPAQQPAVFKVLKFSFNSPHDPTIWAKLLTKYSGLEFRLITYSPDNNVWHYEGAIYVL